MEGKAIIFCAPSGAGKTTIVKYLLKEFSCLEFSISATTRKPREYEKDGKDYFFYSTEEFLKKISNEEMLEWEEVYDGAFYGTLKSEVERIWAKGNCVIFDVDVKGGIRLKRKLGEQAAAIFIKVQDLSILRERLKGRNTESDFTLNQRVEKAAIEMEEEDKFDVVIVNDNLEEAVARAQDVVSKFLR
ncbi:MAG: guanylate kinase [Cyclobacteriaceae bacterium]